MDENQATNEEQKAGTLKSFTQGLSNISNKVVNFANKKNNLSDAKVSPFVIKLVIIGAAVLIGACFTFALISGLISLFSPPSYDPESGELSSYAGVNGTKFYGVRFIYKDETASATQISSDYLKLTHSLILDAKNSSLNISLALTQEYNQDANIALITTEYANLLAGTTNQTLLECAGKINHFGLTNDQVTIVINSIASSLVNHSFTTETQSTLQNKMRELYAGDAYNSFKVVCDNIFLQDYLFANDDDSLQKLKQHNYIGAIYMPKEQVTITNASYALVLEQGDTTTIELKLKNNNEITSVIPQQTADSTWFGNNDFKVYENDSNMNLTLNQFTAINTETPALQDATPLNKLLIDGTYSTYFSNTDNNYSGANLLQNVNSENYLFLEFNTSASFNFAEYIIDFD